MATILAFQQTRSMYLNYTNYSKPLSFDEWNSLDIDHKIAVLFVQFYDEISLAWTKANAFDFITGEEGVSTMCQYLQKNVPRIEQDPKRFSSAYIYRVAYNCLYCICHDRKCDKDRWEYETSNIIVKDGSEYDLFDTAADRNGTAYDSYQKKQFENEFWSIVRSLGDSAEKVLRYLSSGDVKDLKKVNARSKNYKSDPLRDVEVTLDEANDIIEKLKEKFLSLSSNSSCGEYILRTFTLA
jgi:hypothetical protein